MEEHNQLICDITREVSDQLLPFDESIAKMFPGQIDYFIKDKMEIFGLNHMYSENIWLKVSCAVSVIKLIVRLYTSN